MSIQLPKIQPNIFSVVNPDKFGEQSIDAGIASLRANQNKNNRKGQQHAFELIDSLISHTINE
ncbi:hypothetical protein [Photorhabdus noenieputensis]|uniref:hypothetical protein n=1 Tax=Photorhabdus noenieputensis TaxID=1208607 RepID=UPI001BD55B85|nr:hypothetical protein [Photorhabdus noenieputensis]